MALLQPNTARNRVFSFANTGALTVLTVTISKDGAAFGAPAGVLTNITGVFYKLALTAADTDTPGDLAYRFSDSILGVVVPDSGDVDEVAAPVMLADGVAHGGVPGSSTATLALAQIGVTNVAGNAVELNGSDAGLSVVGATVGIGVQGDGDAAVELVGSTGAGLAIQGAGPAGSAGADVLLFGTGTIESSAVGASVVSVTLADGVAHGGTPGTSTATLALLGLEVFRADGGTAVLLHGESDAGGVLRIEGRTGAPPVFLKALDAGTPGFVLQTQDITGVQISVGGGSPGVQIDGGGPAFVCNSYGASPLLDATGGGGNVAGLTVRGSGTGHDLLLDGDGILEGTVSGDADALLVRSIAGGADGGRTVGEALAAARNRVAFDVPGAGQFTVFDVDDTTPLWTGTYTRAAVGALTQVNPA